MRSTCDGERGQSKIADIPGTRRINYEEASGPIPKFVTTCSTLKYELRNLRTTSNSMILVPLFEPEVRDRTCRSLCANFGFGALAPEGKNPDRVRFVAAGGRSHG